MLAVFLGGFVLAGIFCMILLSNPRDRTDYSNSRYEIGGPSVRIALAGSFSRIVFKNISGDHEYSMKNFGFSVEESDSVTGPCVLTSAEWQKSLTATVAGDTLKVAVNLDNVLDSIRKVQNNAYPYPCLTSAAPWGITVVIPRGMPLHRVDGQWMALMLKNFKRGSVEVQLNGYSLVMKNCSLDSVIVPELGMTKLRVDSSTVNYVRVPLGKDDLKVNCYDGSGLIKRMEVRGVNKVKAKNRGDLNLADANISTLVWSPAPTDSVRTLNLKIKEGMEIICNNQ